MSRTSSRGRCLGRHVECSPRLPTPNKLSLVLSKRARQPRAHTGARRLHSGAARLGSDARRLRGDFVFVPYFHRLLLDVVVLDPRGRNVPDVVSLPHIGRNDHSCCPSDRRVQDHAIRNCLDAITHPPWHGGRSEAHCCIASTKDVVNNNLVPKFVWEEKE